jgi:glutaconate CoA-transferase, subunit A
VGAARNLVFSYAGNPGVGSLHRLRDAIGNGWPRPIEIEEHSHAGMANRCAAGAAHLPFAVMRGYRGTDLMARTRVEPISCPFTGEELVAVPALRPDVSIIHAHEADRKGNAQPWRLPYRRRPCSPPGVRWSRSSGSSTSSSRGRAQS